MTCFGAGRDEGSIVTGHGGPSERLMNEVEGTVETRVTGKFRRVSPLQHLGPYQVRHKNTVRRTWIMLSILGVQGR